MMSTQIPILQGHIIEGYSPFVAIPYYLFIFFAVT